MRFFFEPTLMHKLKHALKSQGKLIKTQIDESRPQVFDTVWGPGMCISIFF